MLLQTIPLMKFLTLAHTHDTVTSIYTLLHENLSTG